MVSAEESLAAQIAVHTSWSHTADRAARTAPARKAALVRFESQVDPDGVLTPAQRAVRAEHARKAYFLGLARESALARRSKRGTAACTAKAAR